MKWFNEHLNWTYIFILIIALAALLSTIPHLIILGAIIYLALNLLGGWWILKKKGLSMWYLVLIFVFYILFLFLVFALKDKRTAKAGEISETAYYDKR